MENQLSYQMNAFAPTGELKGRLDLAANLDHYAGVVDATQETALLPGDPVKIVATSNKLPHFVKAAAGDMIMGFVVWNGKRPNYPAGKAVEVAYSNDVMYMEAGAAVEAGVAVNITDIDDVLVGAAGEGASVVGYTMEAATAANQLVRVRIAAPVVYTANA